MAKYIPWDERLTTSRAKPKSPEAEAQRAHDVKAVAAYAKLMKANRPKARKRKAGPPLQAVPQSRCMGAGEKFSTTLPDGKVVTLISKGHKCPDLF